MKPEDLSIKLEHIASDGFTSGDRITSSATFARFSIEQLREFRQLRFALMQREKTDAHEVILQAMRCFWAHPGWKP